MAREQCRVPWRWLQVDGMGLQGREALDESLRPTRGLGLLTQRMEQGSAGGGGTPIHWEERSSLAEQEATVLKRQLAPPTC